MHHPNLAHAILIKQTRVHYTNLIVLISEEVAVAAKAFEK